MSDTKVIALMLLVALHSAPVFAETPHCVASTDTYSITTTQCDNGTVTVVNGRTGIATICSSGNGYETRCQQVDTGGGK